jgi:hypothetical protein
MKDPETGLSKLEGLTVDLLYCYKLQNLFGEYFWAHNEGLLYDGSTQSENQMAQEDYSLVIKAMRIILWQAKECIYFGLSKILLKCTFILPRTTAVSS